MGQRKSFSPGDIQKINTMYQCNGQTSGGGNENSGGNSVGNNGGGSRPNKRPNRPNRPNGIGAAFVNGLGSVLTNFG